MRMIATAVLVAGLAPFGAAEAQVRSVDGSSAAGLCASSLEFVAGARSAAGIASAQELQRLQRMRDLLIGLPQFPKGEVEAYAQAWSQRMAKNMVEATDDAKRRAISNEIAGIASKCHRDIMADVRSLNEQGVTLPPTGQARQGAVTQPQPQPQPLQIQPQPLQTQPMQTQPLILDAQ